MPDTRIYNGNGISWVSPYPEPKGLNPDLLMSFVSLEGRMFDRWINRSQTFTVVGGGSPNVLATSTNHYYWNTQTVRLTTTGTLPTGLAINTTYYIISRTDTTFKLSATRNGAEITITGSGIGTHSVYRYNGYSENDLIENPAYIIESLLRDEIFVERDLSVTTVTSTTVFTCSGLKNSTDGYYVNAIYYNATRGTKKYVTAYTGSTKTITLDSADTNLAVGDKIFFTNIQGDQRIQQQTFDYVGNSVDGLRANWKFRFSFTSKKIVKEYFSQMLFECHCSLYDAFNGVKIIPLDTTADAVDTWTVPLTRNSERELVFPKLTPLSEIYSDFRIKYDYDVGSGNYRREYFVNPSGYTSGASLSVEQGLCSDAISNYKIPPKKYEYQCDFIADSTTAQNLLKKLVAMKTSQKLIVNWSGEISTHIKYEKGDQVKFNYSNMIPTGLNNSSLFMIINKTIQPKKKVDMLLSTF